MRRLWVAAYAAYVMVTRSQPDALAVAGAWSGSWYWYLALALVLVYLLLLFPDGRLPSSCWLPVAVLPGIGTLGVVVLGALGKTLPLNEAPGYEIDNPIGIEGLGFVSEAGLPLYGVFRSCGLSSMPVRRTSANSAGLA